MIRLTTLVATILLAVLLPAIPAQAKSPREITIDVAGAFTPAKIEVRKGEPLLLKFKRTDKPTCAQKVIFPQLGIERDLPAGKTTPVEITPVRKGVLQFTCGMKMMKGAIVVD